MGQNETKVLPVLAIALGLLVAILYIMVRVL